VGEVRWERGPGTVGEQPYALRFADGCAFVVRFGMLPFDDRVTVQAILGPDGARRQ
jgi:hypothetical protein